MLEVGEQTMPTMAQVRVQTDNTSCSVQPFGTKWSPQKRVFFKGQSQLIANQYSVSCDCGAFNMVLRTLQTELIYHQIMSWVTFYLFRVLLYISYFTEVRSTTYDSQMLPLWKKKKKGLFAEEYDLDGSEAVELGSAPPLLQQFSRWNPNARCFLHFELCFFVVSMCSIWKSVYVQRKQTQITLCMLISFFL